MLTSEALPVIGVPPVPVGAMRSGGVRGSTTVTLRRHYAANPEDRSLSCHFVIEYNLKGIIGRHVIYFIPFMV